MNATTPRDETFAVEDDHLVRKVIPTRGRPYAHRCPRASFEHIAFEIDELAGDAFTMESLVERFRVAFGEPMPLTRVAVTLAFLKERGIVETRCRQNYAATKCVHLDAMTEYHALAENG